MRSSLLGHLLTAVLSFPAVLQWSSCDPGGVAFHLNTESPFGPVYQRYDVPPPPLSSDYLKLTAGKKGTLGSVPEFLSTSSSTESIDGVQQKISYLECELNDVKVQTSKYQELLQNSHSHYVELERKYEQARMLIKDYQEREKSLAEREEAHLKQLLEKDHQHSLLVQQLSAKVSQLETQLRLAQQKRASMIESGATKSEDISPALAYQPIKKLASPSKTKAKDFETKLYERIAQAKTCFSSHEKAVASSDVHKTTVVIEPRSGPSNLSGFGVPSTELLDVSAAKSKAETVRHSLMMSSRHPPSRFYDSEIPVSCRNGPENALASPRSPDSARSKDSDCGSQKAVKGSSNAKGENEMPNSPLNVQRLKNMILRKKTQNSGM
ncbi:unnamed protein product [Soboliphyme baturini]|uniref:TBD domain-containing protein n=1 Tax=Soboliphyme baturini TaxID=241478 RepID=A0A183IYR9_9BILA|nr:unnamed protein product [Soboliphyme baturini]